ncbi:MAG TPA: CRISPR-associated endonuclease Cas2 [Negativicutes bacterium]|nr:CRISPR-associated endonuclease Cas2 [Negativicutes bacterium]
MKLSISDQFLWDVYDFLSDMHDKIDPIISPYPTSITRLVAPNTPLAKKYSRQQFSKLISYLKKGRYIKVKNLQQNTGLIITRRGMEKVLMASVHPSRAEKRKDGKWLMVMFDVPEKMRVMRNLLRSLLQNLGYRKFQHSVWVTPYDVLDATEKVLAMHSMDEYVKIFVIKEVK